MSTSWLESRRLSKGQKVRARICDMKDRNRNGTLIEGTVIEDTNGFFEVFEILDLEGNRVTVFYPEERID